MALALSLGQGAYGEEIVMGEARRFGFHEGFDSEAAFDRAGAEMFDDRSKERQPLQGRQVFGLARREPERAGGCAVIDMAKAMP